MVTKVSLYLFNGRRSDFANSVNMVVDESLIVAAKAFCPQVRPTEMSVRVLNSFHVRSFADDAKGDVESHILQLTKHFTFENLERK